METKNIMVVDDDVDIMSAFTDALEYEGYNVYCAENGKVALDTLSHLREDELPGCIFLDLMMPVMDGEKFLCKIHESNPQLSKIPIVVTSANLDYLKVNMDNVALKIHKPVDLQQIFDVAHRYCGSPLH